MQKLTNEVRAELKGKYGADLQVIELLDYDDLALVLRAPDVKAWGAAFDGLGKPATRFDAYHNLLVDCTVWPDVKGLTEIIDLVPALPEALWPKLAAMAGTPDDLQTVAIERLTAEDRRVLEKSGLSETALQEIIAANPRKGQIVAARLPDSVWLLRRPRARQFYTFRSLSAQGKHFDAIHKLTLGCVVWPSEEAVAVILEKSPGMVALLGEAIVELGGQGGRYREGGI